MTSLVPTLQAFFTDRLMRQRHASPHTVAAYRDSFRLLFAYVVRFLAVGFQTLDASLGTVSPHLDEASRSLGASSGAVRMTELTTVSCGNSIPRLWQKRRDQAPPASTTVSQAIDPFSVTTLETRPAAVSSPRTAQPVMMRAPLARAPSAIAGAASNGSARPSSSV